MALMKEAEQEKAEQDLRVICAACIAASFLLVLQANSYLDFISGLLLFVWPTAHAYLLPSTIP
jgi:hypothetical protein